MWLINHYAGGPAIGMGIRHHYLAHHLLRYGIKTTIISASFTHLHHRTIEVEGDFLLIDEEGINRVFIRTCPYSGNNYRRLMNTLEFTIGLRKFIRQKKVLRPDLIIGSSPHLFGAHAAMRVAQRWNVPFYFEVRDLWPLSLIEAGSLFRGHPMVLLMNHLERKLTRAADRLISVLPLAQDYFVDRGLDPAKFIYLPNGVEPAGREALIGDVPLAAELHNRRLAGEFSVLYTGSHGPANSLRVVLAAAKILQDGGEDRIQFYLLGSGPEKLKLQQAAAQADLRNLHFVDTVQRNEIHTILRQAGACYIGLKKSTAYRFGVCPNKLMDYMLAGRPIIYAINSGNHPVRDAGCGIEISPESPAELATAMISMAQKTDEERTAMGERGRAYVLRHHRYVTLGAQLAELIKTDLTSPGK